MLRNAYVLLLLTMLMWGGNAVAGKLAVGHISPMLLTTFRWLMAFLIMVAIGLPQLRQDWAVVRRHLPFLLVLGTVGFTIFNVALYSALTFTTAINASIEQAGMPLIIFVANFLLYRMGVSIGQLVGFSISIVGVALTATHGDLSRLAELDVNAGDALMLVAIIFYGGYTVALRHRPPIHWKSFMLVLSAGATLSSLPFLVWEGARDAIIWPDTTGWGIALFTALFPSILSQVFYLKSVEIIGSNRAGLFVNLVPIFGTLLSIVILGEDFRLYHAVALLMVLGGISLAERSSRKRASN